MKDFRCSNCNRLLAKIDGKAEIKCPKCNEMNTTYKEYQMGDNEYEIQLPQEIIDKYKEMLGKLETGEITNKDVGTYRHKEILEWIDEMIPRITSSRSYSGNILTGKIKVYDGGATYSSSDPILNK